VVRVLRPLRSAGLTSALRRMVVVRDVYENKAHESRVACRNEEGCVLTLDTDVNVVLLVSNLYLTSSVIGLREGVEGLEILDVCGHMID
jgi:hypothetical protein